MSTGGVEEHRKIGRVILLCLLGFSSCNHLVRVSRVPSIGDQGALDQFAINFNTHVIVPVDQFRLTMGETVAQASNLCPEGLKSSCVALTYSVRLVLGLH